MVFFTCGACGDSVKKIQVEKHGFKCRSMNVLTCVDCNRDFCGEEYKAHTKCISEEQKYSGVGWQPKPGQNKGERKQQAWLEMVQSILNDQKDILPASKTMLETLTKHENVPRKKAKFENFAKNIMKNQVTAATLESVWGLLEGAWMKNKEEAIKRKEAVQTAQKRKAEEDDEDQGAKKMKVDEGAVNGDATGKKKKKKQKKKKAAGTDVEKKENSADAAEAGQETKSPEAKGKRKKNRKKGKKEGENENKKEGNNVNAESSEDQVQAGESEKGKKKRNRKRKSGDGAVTNATNDTETPSKKKKGDPETNGTAGTNGESAKKGKKQQQKKAKPVADQNGDTQETNGHSAEINGDTPMKGKKKRRKSEGSPKKFAWDTSIAELLESMPDRQCTLKKLAKDVMKNYSQVLGEEETTFGKFRASFGERVAALPNIKVADGKVAMVTSE